MTSGFLMLLLVWAPSHGFNPAAPHGPSERGNIPSFKVMDTFARAVEIDRAVKAGEADNTLPVLHCEVGQPQTGAPSTVVRSACLHLQNDKLGYTSAEGVLELRQKISKHYKAKYDVEVDPQRIVVTTGSSAGFLLSFVGGFKRGDVIAVGSSGYPCYRNVCQSTELTVDTIKLNDDYKITASTLRERVNFRAANNLPPINGLILSSPSNPTGAMLEAKEMKDLCETCTENGIRFISDEIYHGIVYDKKVEATALKYTNNAIVINSFSKYYSMSGWRLGWVVVPEDLGDCFNSLQQNLFINAPTISQLAASVCWDDDTIQELEANVKEYKDAREIILKKLGDLGITNIAPSDGAFYIYIDLTEFTDLSRDLSTVELCRSLLEEEHVAFTDGRDFEDPETDLGKRRMRISYAGGGKTAKEAMARFERFWGGWLERVKA